LPWLELHDFEFGSADGVVQVVDVVAVHGDRLLMGWYACGLLHRNPAAEYR
jgi:hypothetical protein